jgi:hypothetical protein
VWCVTSCVLRACKLVALQNNWFCWVFFNFQLLRLYFWVKILFCYKLPNILWWIQSRSGINIEVVGRDLGKLWDINFNCGWSIINISILNGYYLFSIGFWLWNCILTFCVRVLLEKLLNWRCFLKCLMCFLVNGVQNNKILVINWLSFGCLLYVTFFIHNL